MTDCGDWLLCVQVSAGVVDIPFFPQLNKEKMVQLVFHIRMEMAQDSLKVLEAAGNAAGGIAEPSSELCPLFPLLKSSRGGGGDGHEPRVDSALVASEFCRILHSEFSSPVR